MSVNSNHKGGKNRKPIVYVPEKTENQFEIINHQRKPEVRNMENLCRKFCPTFVAVMQMFHQLLPQQLL